MHILLVEDDEALADGIRNGLRQSRIAIEWAKDGHALSTILAADEFDLLILDLKLPDAWGLDLLRRLRRRGLTLPVLILSACGDLSSRVQGLNEGADDYLAKPFSCIELEARIRALHRRVTGRAEASLVHGGLRLDAAAFELTVDGHRKELTPREFEVLQTLLENLGRVVTRIKLERSIYRWDDDLGSNALEVHIHNLRKKLGRNLIRTIRGVGYVIENR